ncbi:hypothetical protein SK128_000203 [Halocaridina rubra]|uniref:Uncharacterized protein n=1 Tax=Halocaridina rubra TaxID=373956 RepID=A0AAN8WGM5_HALRR
MDKSIKPSGAGKSTFPSDADGSVKPLTSGEDRGPDDMPLSKNPKSTVIRNVCLPEACGCFLALKKVWLILILLEAGIHPCVLTGIFLLSHCSSDVITFKVN